MYVSDRHRAAFIHIPKTGGTALKMGLLRRLDCRRVGDKHGGIDQLPQEISDYRVYAIVRNPYRRLVSSFRFRAVRDADGGLAERQYPDLVTFLESEVFRTPHRAGKHWMCQTRLIDDRVRRFRFEQYDDAVKSICRDIAVPVPALPKTARTNHFGAYDWREFMSERAVEIINDECRDDFRLFGYPMLTWRQVQEA